MKQTFIAHQQFTRADKIKVIVVLIFMGGLWIVLGFLVGMLFRQKSFEFALPSLLVQATPTTMIPITAGSAFEQIEDCGFSTLTLGAATFQIQDLARQADGALSIPGDTSGIAYHIAGIENKAVFILSPTPQNISLMSTMIIGSPVTAMGPDCTPITYSLTAPQAGRLDGSVFAGDATDSITIFFPTVSSGEGFTFRGRLTASVVSSNPPTATVENALSVPPTITSTVSPVMQTATVPSSSPTTQSIASPTEEVIPTATVAIPTPDYSEVLAEIGLVDTSLSLFRTSLKIEVSIYNFGKILIHLSENDVALTQPDGTVLALRSSKPSLPMDIQPGETRTIELNFATPPSSAATLRVLTVEYDVGGY